MPTFVLNNKANNFTGTTGDDVIHGLGGNDKLVGGYGEDTIYGGTGNDFIQGGFDDDTLFGGAGKDKFRFDDAGTVYYGTDNIEDFAKGDKVDIKAVDVDTYNGAGSDSSYYDPADGEWSVWNTGNDSFIVWNTHGVKAAVYLADYHATASDVIW